MGNFFAGMATAVLLGLAMWLLERGAGPGPEILIDTPPAPVLWRDSLHHARVAALEEERAAHFLALSSRDSLVRELQAEVRRHRRGLERGGSAAIVEALTRVDTVLADTASGGPGYEVTFDLGGWASGTVGAGRDSLRLDLLVRNAYTVVVGTEKGGLFRRGRPYAEVTNRNPYTEATALRALSVSLPRAGKWHIGPVAGLGVDGRPFVGVGIGYGLWGR